MMKKRIELPLIEPIYSTYQYQGPAGAILFTNPSIRNWYLEQILMLSCTKKFLNGYTTPEVTVVNSSWTVNPYLERQWYSMKYLGGYTQYVIKNLLDDGFYVCFTEIDDYYMQGKSFYGKRHFRHDGMICGYDMEDRSYWVYAYDADWVYRKFKMPQSCFEEGRRSMFRENFFGNICGIKPKATEVTFSLDEAFSAIDRYFDSTFEKYPESDTAPALGTIVHEYIAKYLDKLADGTIPYERTDWRIFRLIFEHKRLMHERLGRIEKELSIAPHYSVEYEPLVKEGNHLRMLYASHRMKRRDTVLPVLKKRLLAIRESEAHILGELRDFYERNR